MTDEPNASPPEGPDASTNGHSPAVAASVRSGLAHRRNPVLVRGTEIAQAIRRVVLRDPLALFLLLASIGLAVAFATLLGQIKPASSGTQVPLSQVQKLAKRQQIASATLLDHDSRVVLETKGNSVSSQPKGSATGGTERIDGRRRPAAAPVGRLSVFRRPDRSNSPTNSRRVERACRSTSSRASRRRRSSCSF